MFHVLFVFCRQLLSAYFAKIGIFFRKRREKRKAPSISPIRGSAQLPLEAGAALLVLGLVRLVRLVRPVRQAPLSTESPICLTRPTCPRIPKTSRKIDKMPFSENLRKALLFAFCQNFRGIFVFADRENRAKS